MLQNALDDQLLTRVLFLSCLPLCIIASQLLSRHVRDVFQDLQVDFLVRRHLWLQFNSTGIQSLSAFKSKRLVSGHCAACHKWNLFIISEFWHQVCGEDPVQDGSSGSWLQFYSGR